MCFWQKKNIKGSFKDAFQNVVINTQNVVISISNIMQGLGMMGGNKKISKDPFTRRNSIVGVTREEPSDSTCRETTMQTPCLLQKPYPFGGKFQPGLDPSMAFMSGKKFWKASLAKLYTLHIMNFLEFQPSLENEMFIFILPCQVQRRSLVLLRAGSNDMNLTWHVKITYGSLCLGLLIIWCINK